MRILHARPSTALLSRVSGASQPLVVVWAAGREQRRPRRHTGRKFWHQALGGDSSSAASEAGPAAAPEVYLGVRTSSEEAPRAASTSLPAMALPWPAWHLLAAAVAALAWPAPAEALSLQGAVSSIEQLVQDAGIFGPVVFIAAYVAATVLLVPGSVLTLAAGFLFGPVLGTAVVSVASTSGAAAAFLVGRYLARPAVERRIEGNPRFSAVDAAIGRQGAKIVLLLRLSPLFPFTLLNYGLSLTRIEFGPYVLASWAGMLPGTVAYVALGGAGKAAAETAAGGGAGPLQLALYAVGAGATLWATALISKAASKALEQAEAEAEGSD